jgi:phage tail-like protein
MAADPYAAYDFAVEVDGRSVAGFESVSGLSMELQTVRYDEGGVDDRVHRLPDGVADATLTLDRGLSDDVAFWEWLQDVMAGALDRRTVVVTLTDDRREARTWGWEFADAYPIRWDGPDLLAREGTLAIESVTFAYGRFRRLSGRPEG